MSPLSPDAGRRGSDRSGALDGNGRTSVSVPGKLILMGEHAVVYHRPALVAAVGLRLRVTLADREADGIGLDLPQLHIHEQLDWGEILSYARRCRERWNEFAREPTSRKFRAVAGEDRTHVVKIALGEAALGCGEESIRPLDVRIDSDIPIGAGFGSSASTGVGIVAAYLAHCGFASDTQTIDRLALDVERRQHGLPSGVDHATVLRGGITWAQRNPSGAVFMEPVVAVSTLRSRLRVFDTGTPTESTGTVVSAVRDRLDAMPSEGDRILDRMEDATRAFRAQLTQRREEPEAVVEMIREVHRCLDRLGVVPAAVGELVRRIEGEGGAAKISGAGALTGPGAGCLLVYHPEPGKVRTWTFLEGSRRFELRFGAEGLRGEIPE
jgi:mevalonate kinase